MILRKYNVNGPATITISTISKESFLYEADTKLKLAYSNYSNTFITCVKLVTFVALFKGRLKIAGVF